MSSDISEYGVFSGYAPIIDTLRATFGVDWELWSTGGGCMAWISKSFEGGYGLMITDAEDTLSCWPRREEWDSAHPGNPMGFTVGVFDAEHEYGHASETAFSASAHCAATPENVVDLVLYALAHTPPKAQWPGSTPRWITLAPDLSTVLTVTEPQWTL